MYQRDECLIPPAENDTLSPRLVFHLRSLTRKLSRTQHVAELLVLTRAHHHKWRAILDPRRRIPRRFRVVPVPEHKSIRPSTHKRTTEKEEAKPGSLSGLQLAMGPLPFHGADGRYIIY